MKMYDYRCPDGHVFEAIVSNSDVLTHPCAGCDQVAERMFPAPRPIGWLGDQTVRAVHRTKNVMDRSDIPPWVTDTSKLGTREQTYPEWNREQTTKRMDEITREVERDVGDSRATIYSK
jgi:hypothetical protein